MDISVPTRRPNTCAQPVLRLASDRVLILVGDNREAILTTPFPSRSPTFLFCFLDNRVTPVR